MLLANNPAVEPRGLTAVVPFVSQAERAEVTSAGCEGLTPWLRHAAHRLWPTSRRTLTAHPSTALQLWLPVQAGETTRRRDLSRTMPSRSSHLSVSHRSISENCFTWRLVHEEGLANIVRTYWETAAAPVILVGQHQSTVACMRFPPGTPLLNLVGFPMWR
jgi:hypothetical protein